MIGEGAQILALASGVRDTATKRARYKARDNGGFVLDVECNFGQIKVV